MRACAFVGRNLAAFKPTTTTNNGEVSPSSLAVDGATTSATLSLCAVVEAVNPWWEVDLGYVAHINRVSITPYRGTEG